MMTERLNAIHYELKEMAEREAIKVWRMARRARAKGCSAKLVNEIGEEGHRLYSTYTAYPERLLDNNAKHKLKYAFCGERMKHTYLTVNAETGEVTKESNT